MNAAGDEVRAVARLLDFPRALNYAALHKI